MNMLALSTDFKNSHDITEVLDSFTGGQKIVYIVKTADGNICAVKKYHYNSQRDKQEIELLQRLNEHPGISKIIKTIATKDELVVFEEYVDGDDLEDIIDGYQGDTNRIKAFIINVIKILEPIWEKDIVHRDLKPKNIKILSDDTPVILDFGIARDLNAETITATGGGQPMTWNYAAPEQFSGERNNITYRTDFFQLGLIAYMMYFQRHPYGNTQEEVSQTFQNKETKIIIDDDCSIKEFLQNTLSINPSERARNISILLKTLN